MKTQKTSDQFYNLRTLLLTKDLVEETRIILHDEVAHPFVVDVKIYRIKTLNEGLRQRTVFAIQIICARQFLQFRLIVNDTNFLL